MSMQNCIKNSFLNKLNAEFIYIFYFFHITNMLWIKPSVKLLEILIIPFDKIRLTVCLNVTNLSFKLIIKSYI